MYAYVPWLCDLRLNQYCMITFLSNRLLLSLFLIFIMNVLYYVDYFCLLCIRTNVE